MAFVAGGIACSHSPQLSLAPEHWLPHGEWDKTRDDLPEPSSKSAHDLDPELNRKRIEQRYKTCQRDLDRLGAILDELEPDVLVIVGDDQHEIYLDDNIPALSMYWGEEIRDLPPGPQVYPASMATAYHFYHADAPESYPVNAGLALHLIKELVHAGFDVTRMNMQPEGRSLGHAFTFIRRRLLGGRSVPIVPVFLNTYFPPNQPTPDRCYELGLALRQAVDSFPGMERVAFVGSGGLTHPIIDEDFDRALLKALSGGDEAYLRKLPETKLVEGSSEIRNWLTVAAALRDLPMEVVDYVPAYRSNIGSGCAMGFAAWRA